MNHKQDAVSEMELARPQPIDFAALGHPSLAPGGSKRSNREDGLDGGAGSSRSSTDPDAWIAQPQPILLDDINANSGSSNTGSLNTVSDHPSHSKDPDAWIVRPQLIYLDGGHIPGKSSSNAPGTEHSDSVEADPDAWIAKPPIIDLTGTVQAQSVSSDKAIAEDDPDAWIARPSAIFGESNQKAESRGIDEVPDDGLGLPASIDLTLPKATEAADEDKVAVANENATSLEEPVSKDVAAKAAKEPRPIDPAPALEAGKSTETSTRSGGGSGFFEGSSPLKPAGPVKSHFNNPLASDEDISDSEDTKASGEEGSFFQGTTL